MASIGGLRVRAYRLLHWRRHRMQATPVQDGVGRRRASRILLRSDRPVGPSRHVVLTFRLRADSDAAELAVSCAGGPPGDRLLHEIPRAEPGDRVQRLLFVPPGAETLVLEARSAASPVAVTDVTVDELGRIPLQLHLARQWLSRHAGHPLQLSVKIGRAVLVLVRHGPKEARRQLFASQLLAQSRSPRARAGTVRRRLTEAERAPILEDEKRRLTAEWTAALDAFLASDERLALPAAASPKVSVVLVLYGRSELTFACLRSLQRAAGDDVEVVVVDNASPDRTGQLLDRVDGAAIVRNAANDGFVLACNQAVALARGEHVLLLNNDAVLLDGSLHAAVALLDADATVGVVGGPILALDDALQEAGSIVWSDGSCAGYGRGDDPDRPEYRYRRDVDFVSGAFLLTRRSVWEALGGFDPSFAPAYYEDVDYCLRVRAAGHRVVYEPGAAVRHVEYASSRSKADAERLMRANRRRLLEKHRDVPHTGRHPGDLLLGRDVDRRPRVLVVDDHVPFAFLGSGAPRAAALLRSLHELGWFVTLYPKLPVEGGWDDVYGVVPRDVEVMAGSTIDGLAPFLRERHGYYDCVVVSRPHNMEALAGMLDADADLLGGARLVYDAEAVEAVRDAEERRLRGEPDADDALAAAVADEVGLAAGAAAVLAVSDAERALFERHGVARSVHVVGHRLDVEPTPRPFEERTDFLFVGSLAAERSPNMDALVWFLDDVWPQLRRLLAGEGRAPELLVAGRATSSSLLARDDPGVQLLGPVADLRPLYDRARVFVAPTRYAAGIPIKVQEAAAHGLPVVATDLLAGQLAWVRDEELLAGAVGDADGFARACARLYVDGELWSFVRRAALRRVTHECSADAFRAAVADALSAS